MSLHPNKTYLAGTKHSSVNTRAPTPHGAQTKQYRNTWTLTQNDTGMEWRRPCTNRQSHTNTASAIIGVTGNFPSYWLNQAREHSPKSESQSSKFPGQPVWCRVQPISRKISGAMPNVNVNFRKFHNRILLSSQSIGLYSLKQEVGHSTDPVSSQTK